MADILFHSWHRQVEPDVAGAVRKAGITTKGDASVGDLWKSADGWVAVLAPKDAAATFSGPLPRRAEALKWLDGAWKGHLADLAADPVRERLFTLRTRNGMRGDRMVDLLRRIDDAGANVHVESENEDGRSVAMRFPPRVTAIRFEGMGELGCRDRVWLIDDEALADDLSVAFGQDVIRCEDALLPVDDGLAPSDNPTP